MEKTTRIFHTQMFLKPRDQKQKIEFSNVFPRKQQQFLISDTKEWRNEEKQSEKIKGSETK